MLKKYSTESIEYKICGMIFKILYNFFKRTDKLIISGVLSVKKDNVREICERAGF